jgi:hypothetical protein
MVTQTNGAKPTVPHVKATFQAMLAPTSKSVSRKAWGIDVSTVWLPYFTAARVSGAINEMELSDTDLGAPFRLRRDKDTGEVKFSSSGRPLFALRPNLNDMINRARENFVAGVHKVTRATIDENPDAYREQVERQQRAGEPIIAKDNADLEMAVIARLQAALSHTPAPEAVAAGKKHK